MSAGFINLSETTRLRVTNPGETSVALCLEPWARSYEVKSHSSVEVVFEAEAPGVPEVFHEPDRIVVYGWPDATARVLCDGVELADQQQM